MYLTSSSISLRSVGLPRWYSGQESICQSWGHRFDSWSRKIPYASEQLSPYATAPEPALLGPQATTTEAHTPGACALQPEKPPPRNRGSPHLPQLEKARTEQQRPCTARNSECLRKALSIPFVDGWRREHMRSH